MMFAKKKDDVKDSQRDNWAEWMYFKAEMKKVELVHRAATACSKFYQDLHGLF